jgi:hypothetical protein
MEGVPHVRYSTFVPITIHVDHLLYLIQVTELQIWIPSTGLFWALVKYLMSCKCQIIPQGCSEWGVWEVWKNKGETFCPVKAESALRRSDTLPRNKSLCYFSTNSFLNLSWIIINLKWIDSYWKPWGSNRGKMLWQWLSTWDPRPDQT